MKRNLYALAAAALLAATVTATANAATSVDVRVAVGDPYRGATLTFSNQPDVVLVPDTKVYYVRNRDCDLYRYGTYWYFVEDGFWYRSASWRGPFRHVRDTTVPRSVVMVPVRYRRHWKNGPPSHAVAQGYDRGYDDRGQGNSQGNSHGNGHGEGKSHKH
jgi:hypothetical protein